MVIGADGVNSFVARAVRAPEYDVRPVAACGYYSYFSGVRQDDIELYVRDHHAFGGAPTNDGLHLVMVNWPAKDFAAVRADIEGYVWRALESAPDFAARVREGRREEKWYGTAGVPGYFRKPYGKGWALVGDASYNRDPITAQGISDAFIDAEMLTTALARGCPARARSRRCWRRTNRRATNVCGPCTSSPPARRTGTPSSRDARTLRRAARQPGCHQRLSLCDHRRYSAARFHVERESRPHHGCREGCGAPQMNDEARGVMSCT